MRGWTGLLEYVVYRIWISYKSEFVKWKFLLPNETNLCLSFAILAMKHLVSSSVSVESNQCFLWKLVRNEFTCWASSWTTQQQLGRSGGSCSRDWWTRPVTCSPKVLATPVLADFSIGLADLSSVCSEIFLSFAAGMIIVDVLLSFSFLTGSCLWGRWR